MAGTAAEQQAELAGVWIEPRAIAMADDVVEAWFTRFPPGSSPMTDQVAESIMTYFVLMTWAVQESDRAVDFLVRYEADAAYPHLLNAHEYKTRVVQAGDKMEALLPAHRVKGHGLLVQLMHQEYNTADFVYREVLRVRSELSMDARTLFALLGPMPRTREDFEARGESYPLTRQV